MAARTAVCMIHKIGSNTEQRNENHGNDPGELELVASFFVYYENHEACCKGEGNSKIDFEIFFESENEKGQKEDLNGDEQEVDYETAVNVLMKNFETLFVFDDFIICFFRMLFHNQLNNKLISQFCHSYVCY